RGQRGTDGIAHRGGDRAILQLGHEDSDRGGYGGRGIVGAGGGRAGQDGERVRGVGHGGRQRARVVAAGREREDPVQREQSVARLEPDDSAVRGRDPHRTAGV